MTDQELNQLRHKIVNDDPQVLKEIYFKHRKDCIQVLHKKLFISKEDAEDIFTDAVLVFRDNLISGKIKSLTSAKAYLISTCLNMGKTKMTYDKSKTKKEDQIRLLFYDKNHTINEGKDYKQELIEISQRALKMLSEDCQKIIVAFYIYKIPMKELAQELGLASSDVVKTKKMRCYKSWIKKTKSLMQS